MSLFYKILNPMIAGVLRNPFHRILSKNILLITFTGRKSNQVYTTPVRYVRSGELILCFTVPEIVWWRNFRGGAEVELLIEGKKSKYVATAIEDDLETKKAHLTHYFSVFPNDTMFYGIKLNKDKSVSAVEIERAARAMIVVESKRVCA